MNTLHLTKLEMRVSNVSKPCNISGVATLVYQTPNPATYQSVPLGLIVSLLQDSELLRIIDASSALLVLSVLRNRTFMFLLQPYHAPLLKSNPYGVIIARKQEAVFSV